MRGAGLDLLLVCGFAFDPRASENAKEFAPTASEDFAVAQGEQQYGRLPVLLVRVNPDLAMGDALLEATGAGNLFTVFGRAGHHTGPHHRRAGRRDPWPGRVRPDDRERPQQHDGRHRLLVHRHRLRRGELLRQARLLHRRRRAVRQAPARPAGRGGRRCLGLALPNAFATFPLRSSGKIAVKVVNHYGDEVLPVYDVR